MGLQHAKPRIYCSACLFTMWARTMKADPTRKPRIIPQANAYRLQCCPSRTLCDGKIDTGCLQNSLGIRDPLGQRSTWSLDVSHHVPSFIASSQLPPARSSIPSLSIISAASALEEPAVSPKIRALAPLPSRSASVWCKSRDVKKWWTDQWQVRQFSKGCMHF